MALTSKQRKTLRGMANTMEPTLIVGKDNINEGLLAQLEELLEGTELVKCNVLETSELTPREAADALVEKTGAECVQVIGRRFTLYRHSKRKDVPRIDIDEGVYLPPLEDPKEKRRIGRAKNKPGKVAVSVKARAAQKARNNGASSAKHAPHRLQATGGTLKPSRGR